MSIQTLPRPDSLQTPPHILSFSPKTFTAILQLSEEIHSIVLSFFNDKEESFFYQERSLEATSSSNKRYYYMEIPLIQGASKLEIVIRDNQNIIRGESRIGIKSFTLKPYLDLT
jgi:N-acetylneuraminic acid mutarotase